MVCLRMQEEMRGESTSLASIIVPSMLRNDHNEVVVEAEEGGILMLVVYRPHLLDTKVEQNLHTRELERFRAPNLFQHERSADN